MPLDLAADNHFKDSWAPLSELTVPAIAFHNIDDPTTSYEFIKSMLVMHNLSITLIMTHE
jgi:predicted alpha/beta-fold hydrolase